MKASLTVELELDDVLDLFETIFMIGGFGYDRGETADGLTADQCGALKTIAHMGWQKTRAIIKANEARAAPHN